MLFLFDQKMADNQTYYNLTPVVVSNERADELSAEDRDGHPLALAACDIRHPDALVLTPAAASNKPSLEDQPSSLDISPEDFEDLYQVRSNIIHFVK